mgnify:CR=1 FL=1
MKEKKQTFTVLFWIRKGRTSENMAPLHCRVTISGQRYEIPMNIYLPLSSWSATAQKALGKSDASKEVNRYIEDLKMAIDETLTRIRNKNYLLNIENFKLMFNAQDNEYSTISKLFEYHEIIETKKLKKNTFAGYRITRNHLINYVKNKYHTTDYDISAIDKAFVNEFFAYLQGFNRKDNKKLCTTNGALKHITRFKKVMNMALANEWISRNPACLLKAKKDKVDVGFLNEEEIRAIQIAKLPPKLVISREIFMFAVYTGISYTDMINLTNENITIGIDHSPWLTYRRQKTGVRVALPLLEPAQRIIEEFDCYNSHKPNSHLFPFICGQTINRNLKLIAATAKVKKRVTYHIGRHTFATTITLQRGIPLETVSKMLGHTNVTTTQIYAKVVDNKVMDDMAALKEMYAKKEAEKSSNNKAINE